MMNYDEYLELTARQRNCFSKFTTEGGLRPETDHSASDSSNSLDRIENGEAVDNW